MLVRSEAGEGEERGRARGSEEERETEGRKVTHGEQTHSK